MQRGEAKRFDRGSRHFKDFCINNSPGMVLDPLVERPDVVGADLLEVAERILECEGS